MNRFQWKWIFTGSKKCCTIQRPFWFAVVAILNQKGLPKYKNPPIWAKFGFQHDKVKNWALIISFYVFALFFIHTTSTCIVRLGDICSALHYSNQYLSVFCSIYDMIPSENKVVVSRNVILDSKSCMMGIQKFIFGLPPLYVSILGESNQKHWLIEGKCQNMFFYIAHIFTDKFHISICRVFKVFYNRRYFLNFRRYLKNQAEGRRGSRGRKLLKSSILWTKKCTSETAKH